MSTNNIASPKSTKLSNSMRYSINYNEKSDHRRYKKEHVSKDYKAICYSPISKLSDRVGKYFNDSCSKEDFYRTLLKNNIDPDSKQVMKILTDLEMETNKSHKQTITQLLKSRDEKATIDCESKMICSPMKQTMTSFEIKSPSQAQGDIQLNASKKRRYENSQTMNSEKLFSPPTKSIAKMATIDLQDKLMVKSPKGRDLSFNSELNHRSKKIGFMTISNIFSPKSKKDDSDELNSLAKKYSGSILHNFSSKKDFENKNRTLEVESKPRSKSGYKYKNQVSDMNVAALRAKPDPSSSQIKIVGLYGKAKVSTNADQKNSSIVLDWKVKKTVHNVPSTTKNQKSMSIDRTESKNSIASNNTAVSVSSNPKTQKNREYLDLTSERSKISTAKNGFQKLR